MPKRTNPFQRLIFTIQQSVTDDAVVTESKMLTNTRTGSLVEVDIVIETETGTIPMMVGIECTAAGRPATVEWVREMLGKHDDLPTDKLVLVSQSGYTSEAEEVAHARGIEAISLQRAESFDWSELVTELVNNPYLRIASFQMSIKSWSVTFDQSERQRLEAKGSLTFSDESEVFKPGGEILATVRQLGTSMLQEPRVFERIMRRWAKERKDEFTVTAIVDEGTQISDVDGEKFAIREFTLNVVCEVESTPVDLEAATYGKSQVAFGNVPDIFSGSTGDVTVLFTEQEGEQAIGWLGFSSDSGFGKKIFPVNRPSTHYDSS